MMRVLLPLIVLLLSNVSFAFNNNPLMRACIRAQGQFWAPERLDGSDDLPLCIFGSAAIGAQALFSFKTGQGPFQSVQVYKASQGANCEQVGAITVRGRDTEGRLFDVCQFGDGSLIEKNTLLRGKGARENAVLNQVLKVVN